MSYWFELPPAQAGDRVRVRYTEGCWEAEIERISADGATVKLVQVPESAVETKSDGTTFARITWTNVR
ncbi:hypothetical protein Caci_2963 [Catenulispora acidiphila DSM 44928]|uniref:Uncharacterized protein n=1 Tax=Catenulispora acidiphila (strain DSM 44928 / JCM 14897 / NBRC 102108 / NRRL B-24433 / ID139908) TaxID=479433 RepID=C7Q2Y0_CATAD|nr:hypothetical protein [Catenulispora acidiphila]ACU71872.1 hypothetical protein Caci_2963 [Catenulispora acidiphila DSM 44928]